MRIVCVSDTHRLHEDVQIPEGDVLIHAGDFTGTGKLHEISAFDGWLAKLPHPHKMVVAGNHDITFETMPHVAEAMIQHAHYLRDSSLFLTESSTDMYGIRAYGSPWQPKFMNWAFNLGREDLKQRWDMIPAGIDVLITHGPPAGILDSVSSGEHVGCPELRVAVERVRPRVHVFGHIHESYGVTKVGDTYFINAATCDGRYRPINKPIVFNIQPRNDLAPASDQAVSIMTDL